MNFFIKYTITILLFVSCSAKNVNDNSEYQILYEAKTRGSSISLEFTNKTLFFKSNTEERSVVLSHAEVNAIKSAIVNINLSDIANLKAPSNKRFSDGALSASFKIIKGNKIYTSSDFDHENPPKELKTLYLLLEKFIN